MKCVTLTSDFGTRDGAVASTKAMLMKHLPAGVPVVDISHEVKPLHAQQATYILLSSYNFFEEGSCHLMLANIYYQKTPKLVLAEVNKHFFLAPDNGFLSFTFEGQDIKVWECFVMAAQYNFKDWLEACAVVAQQVITQGAPVVEYSSCKLGEVNPGWKPIISEDMIECHVIHIDRYDNVVLNITQQQIEQASNGRNFSITFSHHPTIDKVSKRYTDVPISHAMCRFNHAGFLEISVHGGQAATVMGFDIRRENHVFYNVVKLEFT